MAAMSELDAIVERIPPAGTRPSVADRLSWIVLLFNLLAMSLLVAAIASTRARFDTIYKDFGAEIPAFTVAVLAIPLMVIVVSLTLVGCGLIWMEFTSRGSTAKLQINVAMALILLLGWCAYVWSLFLPLLNVIESLN